MKVKIRDTVYDSNEEPVMLILTPEDKANLVSMSPDCTKFCSFPDGTDLEIIEDFMKAAQS